MIARTLSQFAGLVLLALIAACLIIAASVLKDAADGFCLQLEPCHTEEITQ